MYYLKDTPNSLGAYPAPQGHRGPNTIPISEEQKKLVIQYNGFVTVSTSTDDGGALSVSVTPNMEAWNQWKETQPSEEEKLAEEARAKRDALLAETDWTQALDAPITADCSKSFRQYRQALRDITEQEGFPSSIEWPEKPEVVKGAPDPVDTAFSALVGGEQE